MLGIVYKNYYKNAIPSKKYYDVFTSVYGLAASQNNVNKIESRYKNLHNKEEINLENSLYDSFYFILDNAPKYKELKESIINELSPVFGKNFFNTHSAIGFYKRMSVNDFNDQINFMAKDLEVDSWEDVKNVITALIIGTIRHDRNKKPEERQNLTMFPISKKITKKLGVTNEEEWKLFQTWIQKSLIQQGTIFKFIGEDKKNDFWLFQLDTIKD